MPVAPRTLVFPLLLAVAACSQTTDGISRDTEPFNAIAESATISLLGNEPFWGLTIAPVGEGYKATYTSPENIDGTVFPVARFAGNNGLGFSGELDGEAVVATVTPGSCSDTMSDRDYPYTATVAMGDATLLGCGYTSDEPFTGEEAP